MPSLQELIAFEAAARHGSFTLAADELFLTQSAVSKQIQALETTLGVVLFERVKKRIVITRPGEAFLLSAQRVLQEYGSAVHALVASSGSAKTLKVAVLPTFANRWLIPRLPAFFETRPMVTFQMLTRPEPFDLAESSVDVAVHFGSANWAHAEATYLCDECVLAVASRRYLERYELREPKDLVRATLLQQASRPNLWRDWFSAAGFDHPAPLRGLLFDQFSMTTEAAVAGLGIALVPAFLVERELLEGSLLALESTPPLRGPGSYYAVTPIGHQRDPDISAFVAWLVEQCCMPSLSTSASARQGAALTGLG